MRILVVGAGGVGSAVAAIAQRRDFFETLVLADLDRARAQAALPRRSASTAHGRSPCAASRSPRVMSSPPRCPIRPPWATA
jgi:malate/lactate dehydrogenase